MCALPTTAMCQASASRSLDVSVVCAPSNAVLVYRCSVRVRHAETGAPISVPTGSIKFDMPSMPMAHNIPPIELKTDSNGSMDGWTVKLDMLGKWRIRVDVGGASVSKTLNFQARAVTGG